MPVKARRKSLSDRAEMEKKWLVSTHVPNIGLSRDVSEKKKFGFFTLKLEASRDNSKKEAIKKNGLWEGQVDFIVQHRCPGVSTAGPHTKTSLVVTCFLGLSGTWTRIIWASGVDCAQICSYNFILRGSNSDSTTYFLPRHLLTSDRNVKFLLLAAPSVELTCPSQPPGPARSFEPGNWLGGLSVSAAYRQPVEMFQNQFPYGRDLQVELLVTRSEILAVLTRLI
ncbi:hypothetical protein RRG08_052057 [Elysia crispata]|uniref:Uncharacterized protein n=1 Tax=Elysia crispata TaxID=231223 RepID=A0AAE1DSQ2_9GAST|nr:hypothetical protein RRG08_052057 [Elysia crispata]